MFDASNDYESNIPYDQRKPRTVHRVAVVEPVLVEYTDHDGRTYTRVLLKTGDNAVFIDQNTVQTNARPWLVKGIQKALGEE